jgi:hypothetical protein
MIRPTLRIRAVLVSFRSAARDLASDARGMEAATLRGLALLDEIEAQTLLRDCEESRKMLDEARAEIVSLSLV